MRLKGDEIFFLVFYFMFVVKFKFYINVMNVESVYCRFIMLVLNEMC